MPVNKDNNKIFNNKENLVFLGICLNSNLFYLAVRLTSNQILNHERHKMFVIKRLKIKPLAIKATK